ncbi:MAG: acyl carrier protein [Candidatus Marinimicrobia bacterium]|nr:acyl carrier protein [Candidatus Neomarinimicrobiota bacterium]
MSDTMGRIKQVTAELLGIDINQINDDSRFVEDLGAESIQSIELVAAFEEEFDIEMDEDAALAVTNVSNAAEFIDKVIAAV